MKRFSLMAVVLVFSATFSAQTQLEVEAHFNQPKAALIVAVGENAFSELPPIAHSVQNAQILARRLEEQGYFVQILIGHDATRKAMVEAARTVSNQMGPGPGQIALFFSGHYFWDSTSEATYLLAYDSDPKSFRFTAVVLS